MKKKPYAERLRGPSPRTLGRKVAQEKREKAAAAEKERLLKEAAEAAAAEEAPAEE